jgi:hypothetical protein
LATIPDNLITLTEKVHKDFHAWNGGTKKPCTIDDLIRFADERVNDLCHGDDEKAAGVNEKLHIIKKTLSKLA